MKTFLKDKYPNLFRVIKFLVKVWNDDIEINVNKSSHEKNALLSYIRKPFSNQNEFQHTSYIEAITWSEVLDELGFNVDVIDYDSPKQYDFTKYDVLCGFGNSFDNSFKIETKKSLKRILYSTGFNHIESNYLTIERAKAVFEKKEVWLVDSIRYVPNAWTFQVHASDGIISIGNTVAAESYKRSLSNKIFTVPTPVHVFHNYLDVLKQKKKDSRQHFLWFGSSGCIHKGLDLLLDYFSKNPLLTLHICGMVGEKKFQHIYAAELSQPNIVNHGFINIKSPDFKFILEQCSYIIFPSVTEGGSPSVLTTIANGALFPIVTKNTSFEIPNKILIEEFEEKFIHSAIQEAKQMNDLDFYKFCQENALFAYNTYTYINYKKAIISAIKKII